MKGNAAAAMGYASMAMNDHIVIYPEKVGSALSPRLSQSWHLASRYWLEEELPKTGAWDKTVVVTHHLPHPKSVSERFKDSPLNPAFASDLSELVENCGARFGYTAIPMIVLIIRLGKHVLSATRKATVLEAKVRQ